MKQSVRQGPVRTVGETEVVEVGESDDERFPEHVGERSRLQHRVQERWLYLVTADASIRVLIPLRRDPDFHFPLKELHPRDLAPAQRHDQ